MLSVPSGEMGAAARVPEAPCAINRLVRAGHNALPQRLAVMPAAASERAIEGLLRRPRQTVGAWNERERRACAAQQL